MKSTVERLSPTRVRINVEVPFDELKPDFDRAYKKIAQQVNVPGFRKGKVPARIIEARLGRGVVLEQANRIAADPVEIDGRRRRFFFAQEFPHAFDQFHRADIVGHDAPEYLARFRHVVRRAGDDHEEPLAAELPLAAYTMYDEFGSAEIEMFQKALDLFADKKILEQRVMVASMIYNT